MKQEVVVKDSKLGVLKSFDGDSATHKTKTTSEKGKVVFIKGAGLVFVKTRKWRPTPNNTLKKMENKIWSKWWNTFWKIYYLQARCGSR